MKLRHRLSILIVLLPWVACAREDGAAQAWAGTDEAEAPQGDTVGPPPDTTGGTDDEEPSPPTDTDDDPTGEPPAAKNECATIATGRVRCPLFTPEDFAAGTLEGARLVDAGGITLDDVGRTAGTDTAGVYNQGSFEYGVFVSDILESPEPFDAVVPSWIADTPPGTWISIQVSARVAESWTAWYRLGVWASGTDDVQRRTFVDELDAHGRVDVDTVKLHAKADAVRIRATLFTANEGGTRPTIKRLTLALADRSREGVDTGGDAWGTAWPVPPLSQMIYPDGGEVWCSPTSTSMILSYWAREIGDAGMAVEVPFAAQGCWDHVYGGAGNWAFSVAFAGTRGLVGEVAWLNVVSDMERYVAAGIPLVISAAWNAGDIDDAAIESTNGHILVVRGFTENGDVAVNDPAAPSDALVPRVYDREQLAGAWDGVVYVLWPEGTQGADALD